MFIGLKENAFGFEGLVRDRKKAKRLFPDNFIIEKPTLEDIMLYHIRREKNV